MISLMYRVPLALVTGGPDWINTELWDVEAKADHSYNLDDLHTMFQNLLADDFKLKFHKETREGKVYALEVDKSGSKMKVNETAQDFKIPINGFNRVTGTRVPMSCFCWWLSQRMDRLAIDRTGLDKNYGFTLNYAPDLPPGVPRDQVPPEILEDPSIFTAVKEQLGLKLEAQKGPVEDDCDR
jgi:uncharacterized protein (TIGR03435 family)